MSKLKSSFNQASLIRYEFARHIIQSCPIELGDFIALTGSVALGVADEHSDIDLCFYATNLPDRSSITLWIQSLNPQYILPELDDKLAFICQLDPFTVELSWQTIDETEKTLQDLLDGKVVSRLAGMEAWNISRALPLRQGEWFTNWSAKLSVYPDVVQKGIIMACSTFWKYPHRVEMLWTLAKRKQAFALNQWIMADIDDALRIICASNRKWEPDWKNLRHIVSELGYTPDYLVERVNAIFEYPTLQKRTQSALEFISDVLRLVPSHYDVSVQLKNIMTSLHQHIGPVSN